MDKGMEIILKAAMGLFVIIAFLLGFVVFKVYEGFNGSYFDKLRVTKVAKEYMNVNYPDLDLEIQEIDYNYKRKTFSVSVYSKKSIDTYFDIFFDETKRVEKDSYELVENGTTTFWRISFGYGNIVREAFERKYDKTLAFCSAELRSDYLGTDLNHVVIKQGLERDKDYDVLSFGKRAGLIDVCFAESVVTKERLAELFLETKEFLEEKNIPFHMIAIILQDRNDYSDGEASKVLSATLSYKEIDENVYDMIQNMNRFREKE